MAIIVQPQPTLGTEKIGVAVRRATHRLRTISSSFAAREIALVVFGYFAYFLVRGFTEGSHVEAVANSHNVVDAEKSLGVFWEPAIQERIVGHQWIVTLANWTYIWGHWPLIAGVSLWLLVSRRESFRLFRTAFFISGAIAVMFFVLFPVAPPRLAELGLVDTVTEQSHAYRVLQPKAFTNQYAAVPSLHFGWNLLIGIAVVVNARHVAVRAFGVLMPILMFAAIVLTANHYIVDGIIGGAVALTGLVIAIGLRRYGAAAREQISSWFASPYQKALPSA